MESTYQILYKALDITLNQDANDINEYLMANTNEAFLKKVSNLKLNTELHHGHLDDKTLLRDELEIQLQKVDKTEMEEDILVSSSTGVFFDGDKICHFCNNFLADKVFVQCSRCKLHYHQNCITKLGMRLDSPFKCESCSNKKRKYTKNPDKVTKKQ